MSHGAYINEGEPEVYYSAQSHTPFAEAKFLDRRYYGDNHMSLEGNMQISPDVSHHITGLLAITLINLQRASLVPVAVAHEAHHKIRGQHGPDPSFSVSTLSKEVASKIMSWNIDTIIGFASRGVHSPIPKCFVDAAQTASRKIMNARAAALSPFTHGAPHVVCDPQPEFSESAIALSEPAKKFIEALGSKTIEALRAIICDAVSSVLLRSNLGFQNFAHDVGDPSLLKPLAFVPVDDD